MLAEAFIRQSLSRFDGRQFAGTMGTAGGIVRNGLTAERAEPRFRSRFRFGQEAVQLLDDNKNSKGDDQKFKNRIEKRTIRNDGNPGCFGFCQGVDVFCAQRDEEVRKINSAEEDPKRGHDNVVDQ